jgi:GxxExxY protein
MEIVYKDAIEHEFSIRQVAYEREKEYKISYKGIILPHHFFADFIVVDQVILEVKAAEGGIGDSYIAQTLNYLKASGCRVGLLVNFGRLRLEYKRLIL